MKERTGFCKNCKWRNAGSVDFCMPPGRENLSDELKFENPGIHYSGKARIIVRSRKLNKNLTCSYYERKWWKFWVKEK